MSTSPPRSKSAKPAANKPASNKPPANKPSSNRPPASAHPASRPAAAAKPLSESDLDDLQGLLEALPVPLEPLDLCAIDGYLCGVLLQPRAIPVARWLPHVFDTDGRPMAEGREAQRLRDLTLRRYAELDAAISKRAWFDPWVFEFEDEAQDTTQDETEQDIEDMQDQDAAPPEVEAVYPWVVGFATAMELFPALMDMDAPEAVEPFAMLYQHLEPDDLEDADEIIEVIESLEPPADLGDAVERLVRATLLLADVSRPVAAARPGLASARTPRPPRRR